MIPQRHPLCVGIPREIKPNEHRVAGLPEHVARLRGVGVRVLVQHDAGVGAGQDDGRYRQAGAEVVDSLAEVYAEAHVLWKVKEILPPEFGLLRPGHLVYTYLHAPPRQDMVRALCRSGCTAIAYEEMTDESGGRPLLVPMSRLAGAGAITIAAQFLQSHYGGSGKLLLGGGADDQVAVTVMGAGTAGSEAVRAAVLAGARTTVLDTRSGALQEALRSFPGVEAVLSSEAAVRELLPHTDVLVNCVMWMPGDPHIVTRDMVGLMAPGSLIVDVSADPGGAVETSVETTHDDPVRVVDGVLHYCVQNIPSLFAGSASRALAAVTFPYLEHVVEHGLEAALRSSSPLRRGVVIWRGEGIAELLPGVDGIATLTRAELARSLG